MAKRKPPSHRSGKSSTASGQTASSQQPNDPAGASSPKRSEIRLRQVPGKQQWELVHPRSVRDRAEDLEEVRSMIDARRGGDRHRGAPLALGWLHRFYRGSQDPRRVGPDGGRLQACPAHFGYAWDIGIAALPDRGLSGPLAYERPAESAVFRSGQGTRLEPDSIGPGRQGSRSARSHVAARSQRSAGGGRNAGSRGPSGLTRSSGGLSRC